MIDSTEFEGVPALNPAPTLPFDDLQEESQHDPALLEILKRYDFHNRPLPIPLKTRYTTRPRRWTEEELQDAFQGWRRGETFNSLTARLNRNPQDIIFKLINLCKQRGLTFTEAGRGSGSRDWTTAAEDCARELFDAGLPAWKIALVFDVDFEYVEKRLFMARNNYGHKKYNPFGICTDHKRELNIAVLKATGAKVQRGLEGYAGEGSSTLRFAKELSGASIEAVESAPDIFRMLEHSTAGTPGVTPVHGECRNILLRSLVNGTQKYDLIDLDPFVTCFDSLDPALQLIKPKGLLFVTFGGEYRRCFIQTNRKTLAKRYRAHLFDMENSEVLAEAPRYMLGELAEKALTHGLLLEPLVILRYPMIVRAYLRVVKPSSASLLLERFGKQVQRSERGSRFNIGIPKWKSISLENPLEDFQAHSGDTNDHTARRR